MPTTSTPARRARLFSCLPLVMLLLLLVTSCRSSQSAYQFRPAAQPVTVRVAAAAAEADAEQTAAPVTAAVAPAKLKPLRQQTLKTRQVRRQLLQAAAYTVVPQVKDRATKSSAQRVRRAAGPKQTSEVGLGTTVLGVLGLVVLPVALLGLLIWGGPVWAILAGLAALAVLVAYLDPFG
ncbi:hypothetical protein [Hymenobacter swuensis]|uniref:Uncharacterized protein n=1 Tax=Hymenobacter swuensis DY53 TaxID=1227739 RepID=W8FDL7_9BACT|nr:hypothetical protein [Hymenobacter swuensis]AHJ99795.1 hypothetical protein Hsw_4200 [Hymenobacter swuensis DY53]